jgi:hypothetical protein
MLERPHCWLLGNLKPPVNKKYLAKVLPIDKMHRSNQIVKRCTAFAHPYGVATIFTPLIVTKQEKTLLFSLPK